jgi:hypothetical protein
MTSFSNSTAILATSAMSVCINIIRYENISSEEVPEFAEHRLPGAAGCSRYSARCVPSARGRTTASIGGGSARASLKEYWPSTRAHCRTPRRNSAVDTIATSRIAAWNSPRSSTYGGSFTATEHSCLHERRVIHYAGGCSESVQCRGGGRKVARRNHRTSRRAHGALRRFRGRRLGSGTDRRAAPPRHVDYADARTHL